jgi:hypothetical protein
MTNISSLIVIIYLKNELLIFERYAQDGHIFKQGF